MLDVLSMKMTQSLQIAKFQTMMNFPTRRACFLPNLLQGRESLDRKFRRYRKKRFSGRKLRRKLLGVKMAALS